MPIPADHQWTKIADSPGEIPGLAEGIGQVEWNGRKICIARYQDRWHAFSASCPHSGFPLAEGWLDAKGNVHCPLHGYAFNIRNGYNTTGEGYHLMCWPVEERSDGIYITGI